jgi:hypothetical protein
MSNQFRAVLLPNDCISISEVDEKGVVVRHVATVEKTAVPQFLDDMQHIMDTLKALEGLLTYLKEGTYK